MSLKLLIEVVRDTMKGRHCLKTIAFVILNSFSVSHILLAAFHQQDFEEMGICGSKNFFLDI